MSMPQISPAGVPQRVGLRPVPPSGPLRAVSAPTKRPSRWSASVAPPDSPGFPDNSGLLTSEKTSSDDSFDPSRQQDDGSDGQQASMRMFSKRLLSGEQILSSYLSGRTRQVSKHFPNSLGVDDFIARVEMCLFAYGFHGDNTIACSNLCRDEVTATLKNKLDAVFGSSFNTNGLGGVLTCGVTGLQAGLSHAPISAGSGKERYVFFSFPHIGIDAAGTLGNISRPGRPGASSACGALKAALADIQGQGLAANCKCPGVHEPKDPEYSILKQRLARRLHYEGHSEEQVQQMNLVDMTKVAERTITDDLEYLIKSTVDPTKADYAVVTGVQIHNWGQEFDDESPNLEFVAPCSVYVVIRGERTYLDLTTIPAMTPRQIAALSRASAAPSALMQEEEGDVCGSAGNATTVRAIDAPYTYWSRAHRRELKRQAESYKQLMQDEKLEVQNACAWPSWQSNIRAPEPYKPLEDNSIVMDRLDTDEYLQQWR